MSKQHHGVFIEASGHMKRGFPLVSLANLDQVLGIVEIQLGGDSHPLQGLNGRGHQG